MIQPAQRSDEVVLVAEGTVGASPGERTEWRTRAAKIVQHTLFLLILFGLWEAVSEYVVGPFWISKRRESRGLPVAVRVLVVLAPGPAAPMGRAL